jgi:hypothetical protein
MFDEPRIHSSHTHIFHLAQRGRYSFKQDDLGRQEWISLRTVAAAVLMLGIGLMME